MKSLLIILFLVIGLSCNTNYYLNAPKKSIPNIGLQINLKPNRILIASDFNLKADTIYFENCLNGLQLNIEAKSELEIVDKVFFLKCPDSNILNELKAKYNADGLLLLTRLNDQKKCIDVPSGRFKYSDNRMPEPFSQISKTPILWTNVYVDITSHWEYYDFVTGKSYKFKIKSDKVLETNQYVSDVDSFFELNFNLLNPVYYLNGSHTASNILGLKN